MRQLVSAALLLTLAAPLHAQDTPAPGEGEQPPVEQPQPPGPQAAPVRMDLIVRRGNGATSTIAWRSWQ